MLKFTDLGLRIGTELLIESFSATIYNGQRVGLIGANGTGKTSLFRLILNRSEPDQGDLYIPAECRIAHMAQEAPTTTQAAIDYVIDGDTALRQVEQAIKRANAEERYDDLAKLYEDLDSMDGYTAKARAEQIIAGLGFQQESFNDAVSAFSGGWRIRLNLARCLMTPSDLLLLDEPTNHLDLDAIIWLSRWISGYAGSLLLISHDREFLDETIDHIAWLHDRQVEVFTGNYSSFEEQRAARLAEQQALYVKQQRQVEHLESFIRRFRYQATKARQAQSRIKMLEKMKKIAPAHVDSPFHFQIPAAEKLSDPLVTLDRIDAGYDKPVISNVNLSLHPGDRIGLLGHNGAGKSTLIKTLAGELALMSGKRTEGPNLLIGYFSQHRVDSLDLTSDAATHIRRDKPAFSDQQIRTYLGGFNFQGDKIYEPIVNFSGGEKARLSLALITLVKPNLLLMDEPTNHLDIEMRQALTLALQEFDGALVLISHDRHLLGSAVDRYLLVDRGICEEYDGDLDDYRDFLLGQPIKAATTADKPPISAPGTVKRVTVNHKASRQLKTRLKTVESRLERLQGKLRDIDEALTDTSLYQSDNPGALQNLLREQINLSEEITELEEEWLTTSEALE